MADEEATYSVEYLDTEGNVEETSTWLNKGGAVKIAYPDGSTFEGTINEERVKHGDGVYTWKKISEDGEEPVELAKYVGPYANGKKHGLGEFTYPNGDTYKGYFVEDSIQGEGTYTYKASGDIFSGTWTGGIKDGEGCYKYGADGSVLKGTWVNGVISEGTWTFTDGTVFTGSFENGKPVGPGSFALQNGIVQKGEYIAELPEDADEETIPTYTWKGESVIVV